MGGLSRSDQKGLLAYVERNARYIAQETKRIKMRKALKLRAVQGNKRNQLLDKEKVILVFVVVLRFNFS